MSLGILLVSFILAAIYLSFENMSIKEYLDLQDSSLLTLWSEKGFFFEKCKGNRVLFVKTWVFFFCADEGPEPDPFFMGTQCIFLTLSFFVYQLRSSFTIKNIFCGKYICLGT